MNCDKVEIFRNNNRKPQTNKTNQRKCITSRSQTQYRHLKKSAFWRLKMVSYSFTVLYVFCRENGRSISFMHMAIIIVSLLVAVLSVFISCSIRFFFIVHHRCRRCRFFLFSVCRCERFACAHVGDGPDKLWSRLLEENALWWSIWELNHFKSSIQFELQYSNFDINCNRICFFLNNCFEG